MPNIFDWISCLGWGNRRSSGKKPNFEQKPQKNRNDSSYQSVVYAHGWQPDVAGSFDTYGRKGAGFEMFYWEENNFDGNKQYNGLKKWTNTGWLNKGWNTAIVYWMQFADEPVLNGGNAMRVPAAEAKIWSFSGPQGSRYATLDANGNRIYKTFNKTVVFNGQTRSVNSNDSSYQSIWNITHCFCYQNQNMGDVVS